MIYKIEKRLNDTWYKHTTFVMSLSTTYQKKTDREHILDAPDTYIGSIEPDKMKEWIIQENTDETEENGSKDDDTASVVSNKSMKSIKERRNQFKMTNREFTWVPGLYKCFDEGIVNARDHQVRMEQKAKTDSSIKTVSYIHINVDRKTGLITMTNDGNGIDIAKHPEHNLWIPEMIFGHLRTSTNYNKDEKKIVGGKNGFGFKLVLIYSKWGYVETVDHTRGLKYKQEFKENLTELCKPKITKVKSQKPYTKISFLPDYARFGMDTLTTDMFQLFKKRTIDIGAVTDKKVKVKFNGELVPVNSFEQYIDLYVGAKGETKRIYERSNDRWEYAVCMSPLDEFTQVSFVNGISTTRGGKHIDYILNQITRKLVAYIESKKKVKVKPTSIKDQLMLFVNCVIENPAFDSQTKDYLNTNASKFGSTVSVSDKFIEKVAKLGVMDNAMSITAVKENSAVAKKTDGKKTRVVKGIPKLNDANNAGTSKSMKCTLVLCEGDSAKAGVVSGLSREDRNYIGVYPLKGKLLNVRGMSPADISKNTEIHDIKKILGLETGKAYSSRDEMKQSLRYGKIMVLTDADSDGHHIKGLTINLFHSHWTELSKLNDFLCFMNTPILKARKSKKELFFYNQDQYDQWKQNNDTRGWSIKYYKGLGTSTAKEFKEYFGNKKIVNFEYQGDSCDDSIDLAFNKKRADDRKKWLGGYNKTTVLNTDDTHISYQDFIHKELIHFSKYDTERSIPNMMDGLKTSQRKILYSAFKRKLTKEIKVAQFGGYISEHSGYHHGEQSLMKAIVGMAQEFVGSNNLNLLLPNGQFGTRLTGGNDSASERYIFTQLNPITKVVFPESDLPVLNYLDDDGTLVEPEFYAPILPMILVNGATGIGTGFSTNVMCYDPLEITAYIKERLEHPDTTDTEISYKDEYEVLVPYFEGFKGKVEQVASDKYMIHGVFTVSGKDKIRITELPIGTWTDNYKQFLETLMVGGMTAYNRAIGRKNQRKKKDEKEIPVLKEYKDLSTDVEVELTLTFMPGLLEPLIEKNVLESFLKLCTTQKTSNIYLFNEQQQITKFDTPNQVIDCFMPTRLDMYHRRKAYQVKELERQVLLLTNKARFIEEQCLPIDDENVLVLQRKTISKVNEILEQRGYSKIEGDYKYLTSMPMSSVMEENRQKLLNEKGEKETILENLKKKTVREMWMEELDAFEHQWETYQKERQMRLFGRKK